MIVTFIALAACAAIAAAAASGALRVHLHETGGDFGTPSVAGPDAELRALIAAGDSELRRRAR